MVLLLFDWLFAASDEVTSGQFSCLALLGERKEVGIAEHRLRIYDEIGKFRFPCLRFRSDFLILIDRVA